MCYAFSWFFPWQMVKCRNKIGQTYSFMEIRKGVRLVGKGANNKKIIRVTLKALTVMDCVQVMFALWGSALGEFFSIFIFIDQNCELERFRWTWKPIINIYHVIITACTNCFVHCTDVKPNYNYGKSYQDCNISVK